MFAVVAYTFFFYIGVGRPTDGHQQGRGGRSVWLMTQPFASVSNMSAPRTSLALRPEDGWLNLLTFSRV